MVRPWLGKVSFGIVVCVRVLAYHTLSSILGATVTASEMHEVPGCTRVALGRPGSLQPARKGSMYGAAGSGKIWELDRANLQSDQNVTR